jgi:hypothetical protein
MEIDNLDPNTFKKIKNRQYFKKFYDKNKENELFKLKQSIKNQKIYAKKRKLKAQQAALEEGGFTSRDGILKKRREVEKALPKNAFRAAEVVHELSIKFPLTQLTLNSRNAKQPKEVDEKVKEFYASEENVVILPGVKDFVVRRDESNQKIKMQKHVLKDSTRKMYSKFKVSLMQRIYNENHNLFLIFVLRMKILTSKLENLNFVSSSHRTCCHFKKCRNFHVRASTA